MENQGISILEIVMFPDSYSVLTISTLNDPGMEFVRIRLADMLLVLSKEIRDPSNKEVVDFKEESMAGKMMVNPEFFVKTKH